MPECGGVGGCWRPRVLLPEPPLRHTAGAGLDVPLTLDMLWRDSGQHVDRGDALGDARRRSVRRVVLQGCVSSLPLSPARAPRCATYDLTHVTPHAPGTGSGIWFNTGKTAIFKDHGDAEKRFPGGKGGKCKSGDEAMCEPEPHPQGAHRPVRTHYSIDRHLLSLCTCTCATGPMRRHRPDTTRSSSQHTTTAVLTTNAAKLRVGGPLANHATWRSLRSSWWAVTPAATNSRVRGCVQGGTAHVRATASRRPTTATSTAKVCR